MRIHNAKSYIPPAWAVQKLKHVPIHGRLSLASLPTPIHKVSTTGVLSEYLSKELNITLLFKRDDMTGGVELGGNKIRKLEFLLADALAQNCDSLVTIGGEQSNHCRATACAARMVGIEPHLILRTKKKKPTPEESIIGMVGNVLMDRLVGSSIYTCTPGEYGRVGSDALVKRLCDYLEKSEGKNPYAIPVGGSNALGTWGYIQGVEELSLQVLEEEEEETKIDHVVMSCGSGGTTTGIALGLELCPAFEKTKAHAVGVCDDPEYFYQTMARIAQDMGLVMEKDDNDKDDDDDEDDDDPVNSIVEMFKQRIEIYQGKGLGYAVSTPDELAFCIQLARDTGIVLDPVYTGKALHHFVTQVVPEHPEAFRDSTILFWHTGGTLGMYEKVDDLEQLLLQEQKQKRDDSSNCYPGVQKLDVYGTSSDEGSISI